MQVICKCCRLRYLRQSAAAEGRLCSLSACSAFPWGWGEKRMCVCEEWKEVMDGEGEQEGSSKRGWDAQLGTDGEGGEALGA